MKKNSIFAGLFAAFLFAGFAFTNPITVEDVNVNTTESVVTWKGYKVTGEHSGTITLKSGAFKMTDGVLTGGSFVMDMSSIKVTDIEGEWAAKLEGHLKSADFFGVENFPTASFEITKVVSRGTPGDYKVIGNLTIKETTKEIRFNANVKDGAAKADITLDRTDFDVRYGSGSFFDNLGDKTIYDEFDLSFSLVLN